MKPFLPIILICLSLSGPIAAQNLPSLSPYFKLDVDDPEKYSAEDFALKGSKVDVNIAGVIADVMVTQTYVNNTGEDLDAEYIFPGSSQSAVSAM